METALPKPEADSDLTEVRDLFNAKAKTWDRKYQAGGSLTFRVGAFGRLLGEKLAPNAKVLDLGCGTAAIAASLSAGGFRVTACDVAEEMINAGKRTYADFGIEWHLLRPDWKRLPFDTCTFDGIVASSVLEYLPDVKAVLVECQRILKIGGILIATIPNPRTLVRKLEKLIRPVATPLSRLPGLNQIVKLHSYATYLKCSRNRMSLEEWQAVAARAHFIIDRVEISAPTASLAYLVCRKELKK